MVDKPKIRQQWIYDQLIEDRSLSYTSLLPKYCAIFPKSVETFKKDWKKSNQLADEYYLKLKTEKEQTSISLELNALKKRINDKDLHAKELLEQIEELLKIKTGAFVKVEGNIIIASYSDEIRAKAEIRNIKKQVGDWYGFNAPTKIAETDTEGNDKLNKNDIKELFEKIDKINNE